MLRTQRDDPPSSAEYIIDTARRGLCVEYCSQEFAGSVLVRDIRVGELFDTSGVDVRIDGARTAWVELLGSY